MIDSGTDRRGVRVVRVWATVSATANAGIFSDIHTSHIGTCTNSASVTTSQCPCGNSPFVHNSLATILKTRGPCAVVLPAKKDSSSSHSEPVLAPADQAAEELLVPFPNDLTALKRHIRKGDIILVEGPQRVSEVIKYLTQSSWSHAAIYIGDELINRNHPMASQCRALFEDEPEGVVACPLSKYLSYNIRVCRPHNLAKDNLQRLLDDVVSQLGYNYDSQNIFDLAHYFFPLSLVPRRFRRKALHFGSSRSTEVICSCMLAAAFGKVGFPILPQLASDSTQLPSPTGAPVSFWECLRLRSTTPLRPLVFRRHHPTLITPRDFDLSPYFDVVKFNVIEENLFDYHQIVWAEDRDEAEDETEGVD